MRGFLFLFILLLLVGCNTTKKVSSHTEATSGNVTDSTSGVTVAVDSTAWSSEHCATIATSTQYAVVTDGDGKPIFGADGRPITYVTRRDTVTKVVNVERFTEATIVTHDTVHVFHRDTLAFEQKVKTTTKVDSKGWWGLVWRILVLLALLIVFKIYVHSE
jgi:uncharacterized protein YceK